ncbi:hypothetical protein [Neorhizobium sp. T7_12]|uniref:hypothetical protein n=1 Tax=Neorhizobium sp. T7_12 TaxID=2093832 RepID=UPI001FDF405D|nr:hypothetical protein [Neorhizobium sp. T7_12]
MNGKGGLAPGDFTIAAKIINRPEDEDDVEEYPKAVEPEASHQADKILAGKSVSQREKQTRETAAAQEEARYSLRNLKRAKQREVKFFVNVALDQATKARLKRAADENDLKMATVMKAAIDVYLRENGY